MTQHFLFSLELPDRFEGLVERLGPDLAKLLVPLSASIRKELEVALEAVRTGGRGLFLPIVGGTGAGKTTFARTLDAEFPGRVQAPVVLTDPTEITKISLVSALEEVADLTPSGLNSVIPVVIDDREGAPPSDSEVAAIKGFLRTADRGAKAIVLWLETDSSTCATIAKSYQERAGASPINIPIPINGPSRDLWRQTALQTMTLCNASVKSIEDVGVSPANYDPERSSSIGEFLASIRTDFNRQKIELISSMRKPIHLTVAFASKTPNQGVLADVTSANTPALLDAHGLVSCTPGSSVGRWWKDRMGLLVSVIVRLDARAFCFPPNASCNVIRTYGDDGFQKTFEGLGVTKKTPSDTAVYLRRTDLGRFLAGELERIADDRGNPGADTREAFELVAGEHEFTLGKDKVLNGYMAEGWNAALANVSVVSEQSCEAIQNLIPDNWFERDGEVFTIEYAWSKEDLLTSTHKSRIAQYVLKKLKDYATALGWVS